MPVQQGKDREGRYYRWGNRGKKYYFSSSSASNLRAYRLALRQGMAIHASRRRSQT